MTISGMPSTRSGRQSTRRTSASDHGARWHPRDFLGGRAELADRHKRIVPAGQAVDRAAGRTLQKRQHKLHRPIGLCRFRRVGNQQPEAARPLARDSLDVVQQPRCRCCAIRDDQNSPNWCGRHRSLLSRTPCSCERTFAPTWQPVKVRCCNRVPAIVSPTACPPLHCKRSRHELSGVARAARSSVRPPSQRSRQVDQPLFVCSVEGFRGCFPGGWERLGGRRTDAAASQTSADVPTWLARPVAAHPAQR